MTHLSPIREGLKTSFLVVLTILLWKMVHLCPLSAGWKAAILVMVCGLKAIYFVTENLWHLAQASTKDTPYHRFLLLMAVCMSQMILSFACDYFCLYELGPSHFNGVPEGLNAGERLFEFFYFSSLNFSFFGFGDLTPATIPCKIMTLLEVALSFLTLIFILSDFLSMKESLKEELKEGSQGGA